MIKNLSDYRFLYSISLLHEYFDQRISKEIECLPTKACEELMHRRGILYRNFWPGKWALLFDRTKGCPCRLSDDTFEFRLKFKGHEFFLYCTEWADFDPMKFYEVKLPPKADPPFDPTKVIVPIAERPDFSGGFCRIQVKINDREWKMAQKNRAFDLALHFKSPALNWEYLVSVDNPETYSKGILQLEDTTGKLTFPPLELRREFGYGIFRTLSKEKISMRQQYDYKLRLTYTQPNSDRKQVLIKQMPFPEPGKYHDTPPGVLRNFTIL